MAVWATPIASSERMPIIITKKGPKVAGKEVVTTVYNKTVDELFRPTSFINQPTCHNALISIAVTSQSIFQVSALADTHLVIVASTPDTAVSPSSLLLSAGSSSSFTITFNGC